MLNIHIVGRVTNATPMQTDPETGRKFILLSVTSIRRYKDKEGQTLRDTVPVKLGKYQAERFLEMGNVGCKVAIAGDFEVLSKKPKTFQVYARQVEYLTFHQPEKAASEAALPENTSPVEMAAPMEETETPESVAEEVTVPESIAGETSTEDIAFFAGEMEAAV